MASVRIWKRDELEEILGQPVREGNMSERSWISNEEGKEILNISLRIGAKDEAPPPIEGVGRWLMWDCYHFDALSEGYRKFLKTFLSEKPGTGEEVGTSSLTALFKLWRSVHCVAKTRAGSNLQRDEWVLFRVCPRHSKLQYRGKGD